VRTLHRVGLIDLVKETRVRGAVEHHYKAKDRPRVSEEAWESASPIAKQASVGSTLQTINDYAGAAAAAGGFDRGEAQLERTTIQLDSRGWKEVSQAFSDLLERADRIGEAAKKRLARDTKAEDASDAALVLMLFDAVRLSEPATNGTARKRKKAG